MQDLRCISCVDRYTHTGGLTEVRPAEVLVGGDLLCVPCYRQTDRSQQAANEAIPLCPQAGEPHGKHRFYANGSWDCPGETEPPISAMEVGGVRVEYDVSQHRAKGAPIRTHAFIDVDLEHSTIVSTTGTAEERTMANERIKGWQAAMHAAERADQVPSLDEAITKGWNSVIRHKNNDLRCGAKPGPFTVTGDGAPVAKGMQERLVAMTADWVCTRYQGHTDRHEVWEEGGPMLYWWEQSRWNSGAGPLTDPSGEPLTEDPNGGFYIDRTGWGKESPYYQCGTPHPHGIDRPCQKTRGHQGDHEWMGPDGHSQWPQNDRRPPNASGFEPSSAVRDAMASRKINRPRWPSNLDGPIAADKPALRSFDEGQCESHSPVTKIQCQRPMMHQGEHSDGTYDWEAGPTYTMGPGGGTWSDGWGEPGNPAAEVPTGGLSPYGRCWSPDPWDQSKVCIKPEGHLPWVIHDFQDPAKPQPSESTEPTIPGGIAAMLANDIESLWDWIPGRGHRPLYRVLTALQGQLNAQGHTHFDPTAPLSPPPSYEVDPSDIEATADWLSRLEPTEGAVEVAEDRREVDLGAIWSDGYAQGRQDAGSPVEGPQEPAQSPLVLSDTHATSTDAGYCIAAVIGDGNGGALVKIRCEEHKHLPPGTPAIREAQSRRKEPGVWPEVNEMPEEGSGLPPLPTEQAPEPWPWVYFTPERVTMEEMPQAHLCIVTTCETVGRNAVGWRERVMMQGEHPERVVGLVCSTHWAVLHPHLSDLSGIGAKVTKAGIELGP